MTGVESVSPAAAEAGARRGSSLRPTDAELVAAFQVERDRDAVAALLSRHQGLVLSITNRYFVPGGDSDDVRQQAMIGFWKAVRDFDPEAGTSFTTFAHTCMRRQVVTAVKAANRYKHQVLNAADRLSTSPTEEHDTSGLGTLDVPTASHEQSAVDRLELDATGGMPVGLAELEGLIEQLGPDAVHRLLRSHFDAGAARSKAPDHLSPNEAHVLVGLLSGWSYEEIAADMDRNTKFVDNTIQRIRAKLRHLLDL